MALHDPRDEPRRVPRFACNLPASVRDRGRPRSPAHVIDISTHGCRIETVSGLSAGHWIWLSLPGLETQYVRVAWSSSGFAGLEFSVPLNPAVLRRVISSEQAPSERKVVRLQELSRRCLQLSEKQPGHEDAGRLLSLARDCETRAIVEDLRGRFG